MEKSTMSKIEAGKVNISYLILHRLSQCLEVPMSDFVKSILNKKVAPSDNPSYYI
jgi:transcriptional regulator with XRE-family HTH domain